MTVLSVIKQVAPWIGLAVPNSFYGSTDRQLVELAEIAREMAERIAKAHEWEILNAQETITGDAATTAWDLPSDYSRQLKKTQLWSSALETPITPIHDRDRWLGLDVRAVELVVNRWIKYGGQIHIKPFLANAVTVKYFYQSDLLFEPASGNNKAAFTLDTDVFRIDERLWKLGIIWQWKEAKGQPYPEKLEYYEDELSKLIADDKGSQMLVLGSRGRPKDVNIAYPWSISA